MRKIFVTKPYIPPLKEYERYLRGIWKRGQLTNHGPLALELERVLRDYLGVKHVFLVTNGTIALQIAIKALGLKREVITTPFSYVATTSSLVWEGCDPVFADIEPDTLTIDPNEIERRVTARTTGIVATHVYGNPCDVVRISRIARERRLPVIYDAAHAFGVEYKGKSLMNYGNISTLSFHATKIFHTIEGGAVVTNSDALAKKISYMRNFGHESAQKPEAFLGVGINGKCSEFQAAMGLCLLTRIPRLIRKRKALSMLYDRDLESADVVRPKIRSGTIYNYSYYPVIFPHEESLLQASALLNRANIYPRRYFLPSLNSLLYVRRQQMPISDSISKRILCLPMGHDLSRAEVGKIACVILSVVS